VDAGKRRSSFRARVRRDAQFATVSSCARRFFKHFNFKFWRTIWYTKEWWIHVSREIWLIGAPSWLKINLLTKLTLSSVRALRGRSLHWRLIVLQAFLNFLYNLLRPETVQPFPGTPTVFSIRILEFVNNFQLKFDPQHCTPYLHYKRRLLFCNAWAGSRPNVMHRQLL